MSEENKKYPPGFEPINFELAGKIVSFLGIVSLIFLSVARVAGTQVPKFYFYVGSSVVIVGIYLILFIPKGK